MPNNRPNNHISNINDSYSQSMSSMNNGNHFNKPLPQSNSNTNMFNNAQAPQQQPPQPQQPQQPFDPVAAYQQQQQQNSFYGSFHGMPVNMGYGTISQPDPQFMQATSYPQYGHMMVPYNPYTPNRAMAYYEDQPEVGGDSIVP